MDIQPLPRDQEKHNSLTQALQEENANLQTREHTQQEQTSRPSMSPTSNMPHRQEHEAGIIVSQHAVEYEQKIEQDSHKSYLTTFLLSLFLGPFGADRFYLNEVGMGLFKLFTVGGLGVWYVVDLFTIMADRKTDKNGHKLRGYKKQRPIALSIFAAWILFLVLFAVYDILVIRHRTDYISPVVGINCSNSNCLNSSQPATSTTYITPYGETASGNGNASGWQVKIDVNQHPQTIGPQASAGRHYMEVIFTITNLNNQSGLLPGSFYYQSYSDSLISSLPTNSGVTLTSLGFIPLENLSILPGKTNKNHYLLFQIPNRDKGKIIWFDGVNNTSTPELAIFSL